MKKKLLSLLLILAMLVSVLPTGGTFAANTRDAIKSHDFVLDKTATKNEDGSYTIQLDAYGLAEITTVKVPTDFILVLDQSGSMADPFGEVNYYPYIDNITNARNYDRRHNGGTANLYYHTADGGYAPVSVTRTNSGATTYKSLGRKYMDDLWEDRNNYTFYVKKNGTFYPLQMERETMSLVGSMCRYTYTLVGDTSSNNTFIFEWDSVNNWHAYPNLTGHFGCDDNNLYIESITDSEHAQYIYSYRADGVSYQFAVSEGGDTNFIDATLYRRLTSSEEETRLDALQAALLNFMVEIGANSYDDNGNPVHHRIAVAAFAAGKIEGTASPSKFANSGYYIGKDFYQYGNSGNYTSNLSKAFLDTTEDGTGDSLLATFRNLKASGATAVDVGLKVAIDILDADTLETSGVARNKAVIVFTDGNPGNGYATPPYNSSLTYEQCVNANVITAENAISLANTLKNQYGVTIYAVGIQPGADGTSPGSDDITGNKTAEAPYANWFLQNVSSNNGTPHDPGYYLSAADSDQLEEIFIHIADRANITTEVDEGWNTYAIRDVVTEQFELVPDSGSLHTAPAIGVDAQGNYRFGNETEISDTNFDIRVDSNANSLIVIGYDFHENAVATKAGAGDTPDTYVGNKLIVRFKVKPKAGFLGGNQVLTNVAEDTGIYEHEDADFSNPNIIRVAEFPVPKVDIPFTPTVEAKDFNVYLFSNVTTDDIATVTVNGVELYLTKDDYGLKDWQKAYVDVYVTYTDSKGNALTDFAALTADETYTVSVKVTPKYNGTYTGQTVTDEGQINIYKPVLTYRDTDVWYGGDVPENYSGNLVSTVWMHGDTEASSAMGAAPELDITYAPANPTDLAGGKISVKKDIPIKVASATIGTNNALPHMTFMHQDCSGITNEALLDGQFLLHPQTCTLTVTKQGGSAGEPYVFTVYKDGKAYTQLSITGNGSVTLNELPVGTYTVTEDSKWSWRYTLTYINNDVTLDSDNPSEATITCTNKLNKTTWLNSFSAVVKNIFGDARSN